MKKLFYNNFYLILSLMGGIMIPVIIFMGVDVTDAELKMSYTGVVTYLTKCSHMHM